MDLKTLIPEGARFKRVGGVPVGETDAQLAEFIQDTMNSTLTNNAQITWSYNDLLNQIEANLIVSDDDTIASPSTTEVLSSRAVKEYVDTHSGGGGGGTGDISTTDTTVKPAGVLWSFVLDEDTFVSNSDTKLATQQSIRAFVSTQAIVAQLASTDTTIIDVYTVGGVTYLDVSGVTGGGGGGGGSTFADNVFDIHDDVDITKIAKFSVGGLFTGSTVTYTLPDATFGLGGSVGTELVATDGPEQTISGRKIIVAPTFYMDKDLPAMRGVGFHGVNDFSRGNPLEIFGFVGGLLNANLAFLHARGVEGATTQTLSGDTLGQILMRGTASANTYSGGSSFRVLVSAEENIGATARGASATLGVGLLGGALASALKLMPTATKIDASINGALAIGAGSGVAAPGSGLALDIAAGAGLLGVPIGTLALVNGANNNVAIPTNSVVTVTGPTAAFSLSGIVAPASGKGWVYIINRTTQNMTITNEATSTAANRINTLTGADQTSTGDAAYMLMYDSVTDPANPRWIKMFQQV